MKQYIVDEFDLRRFLKLEALIDNGANGTIEERLNKFEVFCGERPRVADFLANATKTELSALNSIVAAIGIEGNFSIVKMIQATGISRPVFTSLNQKLKEYGIAEVENQGVKGTHLKLLASVEELGGTNE